MKDEGSGGDPPSRNAMARQTSDQWSQVGEVRERRMHSPARQRHALPGFFAATATLHSRQRRQAQVRHEGPSYALWCAGVALMMNAMTRPATNPPMSRRPTLNAQRPTKGERLK